MEMQSTSTSHWLWTLKADIQPLNHGLNSAWQLAQDRGRWRQLCSSQGLTPVTVTRDDDDDDERSSSSS